MVADYKEVREFPEIISVLQFMTAKGMSVRNARSLKYPLGISLEYFKLQWVPADALPSDITSKRNKKKRSFKVSVRSVIHHGIHLAISEAFGPYRQGGHRYVLLSEVIALVSDHYFGATLYLKTGTKSRYVKAMLSDIMRSSGVKSKLTTALFNVAIENPFAFFKKTVIEFYELMMILNRGSMLPEMSEIKYLEIVQKKLQKSKILSLYGHFNIYLFTVYSLKYCGNKLGKTDSQYEALKKTFKKAKSFDDFFRILVIRSTKVR